MQQILRAADLRGDISNDVLGYHFFQAFLPNGVTAWPSGAIVKVRAEKPNDAGQYEDLLTITEVSTQKLYIVPGQTYEIVTNIAGVDVFMYPEILVVVHPNLYVINHT